MKIVIIANHTTGYTKVTLRHELDIVDIDEIVLDGNEIAVCLCTGKVLKTNKPIEILHEKACATERVC